MSWAVDVAWGSSTIGGTGTTHTFTYGSAVTTGSMLVCFIGVANTAISIDAVSDDVNGAWTQFAQGSPLSSSNPAWIWAAYYLLNSAPGTPTITATFNTAAGGRCMVAASYTGIATSGAFDVGAGQTQTNPGTGADAVSTTATGTTAQNNSLAIAAMRVQVTATVTGTSGWTQRLNADIGSASHIQVEDKNIASPSTVTATWTITDAAQDTMSIVGVFKEEAGAAAPTPFFTQLSAQRI